MFFLTSGCYNRSCLSFHDVNGLDLATEQQLVDRAKCDFSGFDILYGHYFPKVFSFVRSKINDDKQTEDLVSEIFLKVLRGLKNFEWRNLPFGAWLFAVARNHLKDYYVKMSHHHDSLDIAEMEVPDEERERDPRANAGQNEIRTRISKALSKLDGREQEILRLKFFAGLRNTEIAATLNLSQRNVAVILFRSLRKLKEPLSQLNT